MELEITEQSQYLLELLLTIPPQFDTAKTYLDEHSLSSEEITKVGILYAEKCFLEVSDCIDKRYAADCDPYEEDAPQGIVAGLHSTYVYEVVNFLLPYGLNPNAVYNTQGWQHNIMDAIVFVDNEYLAADTMALLLENGGDPNLQIEIDTLFSSVDDDIGFGSFEQERRWRYDSWVHLWMVLLAYGGKLSRMQTKTKVFKEYNSNEMFDLRKLRNHRNYIFGLSWEKYEAIIHIFDKRTFWEVARY